MRAYLLSAFLVATALISGVAQNSTDQKPTVAEAQAFVDRANAEVLKLSTDTAHADWIAVTYITDDTESTDALINEQFTAHSLELTKESHRWDNTALPPEVRRQIKLMQLNTP